MNRTCFSIAIILVAYCQFSCSPKSTPYENGPVMSKRNIDKTFKPILAFMEVRPGCIFADFGAGSGAITVIMSTLMEGSSVYIQDIDTITLNQRNLDKIIAYYSKQTRRDLRNTISFHRVIGEQTTTKLPDGAFDVIYSNATMHVIDQRDSILTDLHRKLKPDGKLFIRDSFRNDHKEGEFCSDKKCNKPLLTIDEFLALMDRNNFKLVKQSPDMSGYPVFGFETR